MLSQLTNKRVYFLKRGSVNKSNHVKLPLKSSVFLFVVQCVVVQHLLQQAVLLQRVQPPASVC